MMTKNYNLIYIYIFVNDVISETINDGIYLNSKGIKMIGLYVGWNAVLISLY